MLITGPLRRPPAGYAGVRRGSGPRCAIHGAVPPGTHGYGIRGLPSWSPDQPSVLCSSSQPSCSCGACSKPNVPILLAFGRWCPEHSYGCRAFGASRRRGRPFLGGSNRPCPVGSRASRTSGFTSAFRWVHIHVSGRSSGQRGDRLSRNGRMFHREELRELRVLRKTMGIRSSTGGASVILDDEQSARRRDCERHLANVLSTGSRPDRRRIRTAPDGPCWKWLSVGEHRQVPVPVRGHTTLLLRANQRGPGFRALHVPHDDAPPEALASPSTRAIRAFEPNMPLYDVQSMTQALESGLRLLPCHRRCRLRCDARCARVQGCLAPSSVSTGSFHACAGCERRMESACAGGRSHAARHVRLRLHDGLNLVVLGARRRATSYTLACSQVVRGALLSGISAHDPLALVQHQADPWRHRDECVHRSGVARRSASIRRRAPFRVKRQRRAFT